MQKRRLEAFLRERLEAASKMPSCREAAQGKYPDLIDVNSSEVEDYLFLIDLSTVGGRDPDAIRDRLVELVCVHTERDSRALVQFFELTTVTTAVCFVTVPGSSARIIGDVFREFEDERMLTVPNGEEGLNIPVMMGDATPLELFHLYWRYQQFCPDHALDPLLEKVEIWYRLAAERLKIVATKNLIWRAAQTMRVMRWHDWDQLLRLPSFKNLAPLVPELLPPYAVCGILDVPVEERPAYMSRLLQTVYAHELHQLLEATERKPRPNLTPTYRAMMLELVLLEYIINSESMLHELASAKPL